MHTLENIDFCLEHGVFGAADQNRLLGHLTASDRVPLLADAFGVTLRDMALRCLDAGIVYVRARLTVPEAEGQWFSPPPVPDEGWDCMADNPAEWEFYSRQFCPAICDALGVPRVVLHHVKLTPEQAAERHRMDSVGLVVAAMTRLQLPFRAEEWPLDSELDCRDLGGLIVDSCAAHTTPVTDALKCFSAKVTALV